MNKDDETSWMYFAGLALNAELSKDDGATVAANAKAAGDYADAMMEQMFHRRSVPPRWAVPATPSEGNADG